MHLCLLHVIWLFILPWGQEVVWEPFPQAFSVALDIIKYIVTAA